MEEIWEGREDCRNGLIYCVNCIKKGFRHLKRFIEFRSKS